MPVIRLTTTIEAPRERVFDLSRSIDAHIAANTKVHERPIQGKTAGLIGLGEEVTWEAWKYGIRQRLKVRITAFDRPFMFVDEMVTGAFKSMRHTHRFEVRGGGTEMTDEFEFRAPLGPLGRFVEFVVLTRFMHAFLSERNRVLKETAESARWKTFLPEDV